MPDVVDVDEISLADAAPRFRKFVAANKDRFAAGNDILQAALDGDEDIQDYIRFVLGLRENRKTRRTWEDIRTKIEGPCPQRTSGPLAKFLWNLFVLLRAEVYPWDSSKEDRDLRGISKKARGTLQRTGLLPRRAPSLDSRYLAALKHVQTSMAENWCAMWVDNYNRNWRSKNPNKDTLNTLNCTAIAVHPMSPPASPFQGYPTLVDILGSVPALAERLVKVQALTPRTVLPKAL